MTLNQALLKGFEVKIKTGYIDNQFMRDVITLRVEVRKDSISGYGWREISEEALGYTLFINVLIDKLIAIAIDDYEKKLRATTAKPALITSDRSNICSGSDFSKKER